MFSVFYQQDLTKALFIGCLFMQRVLQVPCNGRSRLAKKAGAVGNTRLLATFTLCKHAACSNELFSLSSRLCFGGKRFDWANVNFWLWLYLSFSSNASFQYIFSVRCQCSWDSPPRIPGNINPVAKTRRFGALSAPSNLVHTTIHSWGSLPQRLKPP